MKGAIKNVQLPCSEGASNDGKCKAFPDKLQSLGAVYSIQAVSLRLNKSLSVGFWKLSLENGLEKCFSTTRIDRQSDISFGPDLFSAEEKREGLLVPTSSCRPVCKPGEERYSDPDEAVCCHKCRKCESNYYSNGTRCMRCENGSMPNENSSGCDALPVVDALGDPARFTLMAVCIVFLFILVGTIAIYFRFWTSPIVRASDRPLTLLFLLAMVVSLLLQILLLAFQDNTLCALAHLVSSMSLVSTVAVIVVKTGRMARIYFATRNLRAPQSDWTMMTHAQVIFVFVLLSVCLALQTAEVLLKPPARKLIHTDTETFEVCQEWITGAIAMDSFTAGLILIAAVLAFFTRKLNLNFSEAHFLFLASLSLTLVWTTMRVTYYLVDGRRKVLFRCLFVLAHVFVLWCWLVAPRLYIILWRPRKNSSASLGGIKRVSMRKKMTASAI